MPDNLPVAAPGASGTATEAPVLSFTEFLRRRAEEFGVQKHHARRQEWLGAIRRFLDQVHEWLRQADPDGLLEVEEYDVRRTEPMMGTYEVPALKIRLGAIDVDVVPVGREVPFSTPRSASGTAKFTGRVDMTDGGMRTYNLYREARDGKDRWQIRHEHNRYSDLDRDEFERILRDLLS